MIANTVEGASVFFCSTRSRRLGQWPIVSASVRSAASRPTSSSVYFFEDRHRWSDGEIPLNVGGVMARVWASAEGPPACRDLGWVGGTSGERRGAWGTQCLKKQSEVAAAQRVTLCCLQAVRWRSVTREGGCRSSARPCAAPPGAGQSGEAPGPAWLRAAQVLPGPAWA